MVANVNPLQILLSCFACLFFFVPELSYSCCDKTYNSQQLLLCLLSCRVDNFIMKELTVKLLAYIIIFNAFIAQ